MVYLEKRLEMFSCVIYFITFVMYYVILKVQMGYMCSINMTGYFQILQFR